MESAFYSCVDDTIEDAFDASSDTEPADSDASTSHLPSHTRLNPDTEHTDTDSCNKASDWFTDSQRERLSHDNLLQGNSTGIPDSRTLPAATSLRLRQSSVDNKYSLPAGDGVNSNLAATDVYHSEVSRHRTSRCHENVYVNKSDSIASRQSLLKSKSHMESAKSHFAMSSPTLPSSRSRLADTVFLPDDKVMEIVEEQLENDDDDDYSDDDDDDDDNDDDIDDDVRCMMSVKPVDDVESDAGDSEVDEVEEISEDDEDGLAEEERAVLQEAARAAAEASNDQSTDKTVNYPTNAAAADVSVQNICAQPASDALRELLLSVILGFISITPYHDIDHAFVDLAISRHPHVGRHRARMHVSLVHCLLAQAEFTAQMHTHTLRPTRRVFRQCRTAMVISLGRSFHAA